MIKIKLRRNLLYLFVYFIAWIITTVFEELMSCSSYVYLSLAILSKIFGGLIVYLYQYNFIKRNKKQTKYFEINLIFNEKKLRTKDKKIKITILLFFASFFYVFRFFIDYQFFGYLDNSPTIDYRLSSMQTVSSALICTYALGFEMKKHHKVSLVIISIFLGLTFIIKIIYKSVSINLKNIAIFNLLILYYYIAETFSNCIEKYLVDFNYINPFLILMLEGIIDLIMASIYISIYKKPIRKFNNKIINNGKRTFLFYLFGFIIYVILAAITHIYKIYCNVIYSPMARALVEYLLNPFFNIYTFFELGDFNKNVSHLIISIIICIIISFFGCVYNEYIILYFCGLENETKDVIAERALDIDNVPEKNNYELDINDNENENFNDDNKDKIKIINKSFRN